MSKNSPSQSEKIAQSGTFLIQSDEVRKSDKEALGIWNYPYDALEAVVNALYHRDYRQYEPVEDLKSRVRIRKMMKAEPTITRKGIAELLGVTSKLSTSIL